MLSICDMSSGVFQLILPYLLHILKLAIMEPMNLCGLYV